MKRALWLVFAVFGCSAGLWAHHSYGMFYFTDQHVTLKGTVSKITFVDPHAMLTIETKNSGTWQAEWTKPATLVQYGVQADTVKVGDVLEIQGSPSRNPDAKIISALDEIRRVSDGWSWTRAGKKVIE